MTMSVKSEPQKTSGPQDCAGCGKRIADRYLLKALDVYWHEDCLKCGCCDCRLGEVGSTLYTKGNLILCKRDYLRLFGTTGYCSACSKVIPAFEMVMRARTNVYHLECFACQQCNHRFCVGDRFFLCDNKILCEYDYEERMVFANLAYNSSNLAQIKSQARAATNSSTSKQDLPPPPPANGLPATAATATTPNGMAPPPPMPTMGPMPPTMPPQHQVPTTSSAAIMQQQSTPPLPPMSSGPGPGPAPGPPQPPGPLPPMQVS